MHDRRVEERALPARAVLEREAAQIKSRNDAGGKRRRGNVQNARGTDAVQRGGPARPVVDEGDNRFAHRAAAARPRQAAGDSRERAAQRSDLRAFAVARDIAGDDGDIDDEVPDQEREHRRRQNVDSLRGVDLVEEEAERKGAGNDDDAYPRPPLQRTHGSRQRRLPNSELLDRQRRPAGEEGLRRALRPDDFGRGPARPRAVLVGPERALGVRGFDCAHRDDFQRRRFVQAHRSGVMTAFSPRRETSGNRRSLAKRSCASSHGPVDVTHRLGSMPRMSKATEYSRNVRRPRSSRYS